MYKWIDILNMYSLYVE